MYLFAICFIFQSMHYLVRKPAPVLVKVVVKRDKDGNCPSTQLKKLGLTELFGAPERDYHASLILANIF